MNNFKKLLSLGIIVAMLGMVIIPRLSFANYVVSPSFTGNSNMNVATANQICDSLPDAIAAQQSFCVSSGNPSSTIAIADQNILISVTSSTSARITWNTTTPTTSVLWYSSDPYNQNASVQYNNANDGYTTYHTIYVSGIDLMHAHIFKVGGSVQGSGVQVSSNFQLI